MKRITSRRNPIFLSLLRLGKSSRERHIQNKTLLDGSHLISAYYARIGSPEMLIVRDSAIGDHEVGRLVEESKANVTLLIDSLFNELSPVKTPSGVLAIISVPKLKSNRRDHPVNVVLEDIQDPGNMGSILRSAAGAGVQNIYLSPRCVDVWSPKVLRAGMGAHFEVSISLEKDLPSLIQNHQSRVVATIAKGGRSIFETNLRPPVTFVFGNEGAGVSSTLLKQVTEMVTVPMIGRIESLNVAATAAVCFFESLRQRT